MEALESLFHGFGVLLTFHNMLLMLVGITLA